MKERLRTGLLPILLALSTPASAAMAGGSYALGIGDQVQLKVYDWRSAVGDVREWTALTGKFTIGADGDLSLPLIGTLPAAGNTLDQLSENIAARLQQTVGLASRPQVAAEVAKYRPFYILGAVNKPGEYPFRPGMTVLQAVSIGGGLFRLSDPSLLFGRGLLTTAGELRVLQIEHSGLLARRARLQAELADANELRFPPQLLAQQKDANIAQAIAQEQATFTAHRDAVKSQTEALNRLKELLNSEVSSLQQKMAKMDQELTLLKQELTSTTSLVQRGLAAAPREFNLRQTELETETRRLDLDTAVLRAREDIGKADQSIIELRNKTRNENLAELAQVESKLAQTAARIRTNQMLMAQDGAAPDAEGMLGDDLGAPSYTIIRRDGAEAHEIAATENTEVQPGDTVQVKRPMPTSPAPVAELGQPSPEAPLPNETAAATSPLPRAQNLPPAGGSAAPGPTKAPSATKGSSRR